MATSQATSHSMGSVSLRAASSPLHGNSPRMNDKLPRLNEGTAHGNSGIFQKSRKKGYGMIVAIVIITLGIIAVIALSATGVIGKNNTFGSTSGKRTIQAKSENPVTGDSPIPATKEPTGDQIPRLQLAHQAGGLGMAYLEAQRAGAKPSDAASVAPQVRLPSTSCRNTSQTWPDLRSARLCKINSWQVWKF